MANDRDVVITGVGLLSSLGEGVDAHWAALESGVPHIETEAFAPFLVHPMVAIDLDRQIAKRSDQRQMEPWQRIGVYAAGLALEDAGLRGNAEILQRVDMLVAAGGGERDVAVDSAILTDLRKANDPGRMLNERLMADLRPTLTLAQLSNLLAGNISIVHGVVGSSRTFMGEEMSSVDALRIAAARISAGQSDIGLVGAAYNGERKDQLLHFAFGGVLARPPHRSVWDRTGEYAGFALSSLGGFLVIEARAHALARGARIYGRLAKISSDSALPRPGAFKNCLDRFIGGSKPSAVISGATGVQPVTAEERDALSATLPDTPVRATSTMLGHGIEAQFPFNIALAAVASARRDIWTDKFEPLARRNGVEQILVTGRGQRRGIGLALVEAD